MIEVGAEVVQDVEGSCGVLLIAQVKDADGMLLAKDNNLKVRRTYRKDAKQLVVSLTP